MVSRRGFLQALLATSVLSSTHTFAAPAIDRHALVRRHNPRLTKIDPLSPFSLGNGEFAFTADVTGLQTFPRLYADAMPLCTMSQWGWHTRPRPSSLQSKALRPKLYETYGRKVGYNSSSEGQTELFNWLRENSHRLHLGQIGLADIDPANVSEIDQELDLWRGVLNSKFKLSGEPVSITTAVHPERDLLAVVIRSRVPRLAVRIAFPYGSPSMQAADWTAPDKHQTTIITEKKDRTLIARQLDGDTYYVTLQGQLRIEGRHTLLVTGSANRFEFVVAFSQQKQNEALPTPLPVKNGVYLAHENCPETFSERNHDHPSMLGAFGVLPGDGVDKETMRRTLRETMQRWQWDKTWGWDYPMTAMTAARLGETSIAIDALMMQTEKNRYLPNGHNWQRPNLPCYLPGNGGLLYAVAMMAGRRGFPSDGSWTVRSENIRLNESV